MGVPTTMMAVVTTGNGGYDKLDYREVPTPTPGPTDVLLKVHAAGVNNTEINTRLGWYSSSVETATSSFSDVQSTASEHKADGGWNDATPFPIIQGTDCCGSVVAVGRDVGHEPDWAAGNCSRLYAYPWLGRSGQYLDGQRL